MKRHLSRGPVILQALVLRLPIDIDVPDATVLPNVTQVKLREFVDAGSGTQPQKGQPVVKRLERAVGARLRLLSPSGQKPLRTKNPAKLLVSELLSTRFFKL